MHFNDLGVSDALLKALEEKNYHTPTEIQTKAIPLVLQKKDVLGCAQTGTGKTAAFAVPIIQLLTTEQASNVGRKKIRSLILTPTRELAIQIGENIEGYSKFTHINHTVIFGGVPQSPQVNKLKKGIDILVATPGRLLDLIGQGYINLNSVKLFVLDEADRMLDMGFINDIKRVLKLLPEQKQSLFFSATMPENIVKLSRTILHHPVKIEAHVVSSSAESVEQFVYFTNSSTKKPLLNYILKDKKLDQVLIFARTKRGADRIVKNLTRENINAMAIHGDRSQNQRQKALKLFKEGKIRILVATDIASRGIDIKKLNYVINYDIPSESESYVHRIGRSGRAGETGIAISICEPEENVHIRAIEKLIKKKLIVLESNHFPQTEKAMTAAEKKQWNIEKDKRKQAYFASRNKKRSYR